MTSTNDRQARLQVVRESTRLVEARLRQSRRRDSQVFFLALVCTLVATVMAGIPGLTGLFIIPGWQLTCALTASLTGTATLVTGVRQQVAGPDRVLGAATLLARLRTLEIGLALGRTSVSDANMELVSLLREFPELLPEAAAERVELTLATQA